MSKMQLLDTIKLATLLATFSSLKQPGKPSPISKESVRHQLGELKSMVKSGIRLKFCS